MTERARKTLLVIEDDDGFRRSLVSFLEDCDFDVVDEPNGEAGVARFLEVRPDLVLTDLRMPGMGGMEVLAAVRDSMPEVPVVIISGTADKAYLADTVKRGASAYVTKPIENLGDLEVLVRRLLAEAAP